MNRERFKRMLLSELRRKRCLHYSEVGVVHALSEFLPVLVLCLEVGLAGLGRAGESAAAHDVAALLNDQLLSELSGLLIGVEEVEGYLVDAVKPGVVVDLLGSLVGGGEEAIHFAVVVDLAEIGDQVTATAASAGEQILTSLITHVVKSVLIGVLAALGPSV